MVTPTRRPPAPGSCRQPPTGPVLPLADLNRDPTQPPFAAFAGVAEDAWCSAAAIPTR